VTDAVQRLAAALADRYRIERELGAGGMATVYLAQDLKHNRQVAIKVLKPELAAVLGADRFVQEIQTTAQLQHPHILPLFDSGQADSFLYYVMPYIQGETLRTRLDREHQLGVDEAVRIASEVADALDYAHRQGVIHRDIKPENILLHDGRPMVADFGIALAVSAAAGGRMTETGLSLGTPHYMSPEQATAEREITGRSDIYSLASVLYEMLTGNPPHVASSAQQIIAKIVTEAPAPVSQLRKTVPPNVAAAVAQALEKLPADRFDSAKAFAHALSDRSFTSAQMVMARAAGDRMRVSDRLRDPWTLTLGGAVVVLAALAAWALTRTPGGPAPVLYDAGLPDSAQMFFSGQTPSTPYGSPMRNLSLAPDGSFVVYLAQAGESTVLWRRDLRDGHAAVIPGTDGGTLPRLSPDGTRLAFVQVNHVMVLPIGGGPARRLIDVDGQATALIWLAVNRLAVVDNEGYRMRWLDPEGGEIEHREIPRCIDGDWWPGGKRLICSLGGIGRVIDPVSGMVQVIRSSGTAAGRETMLSGSAFRVIGDHYLVYTSPEGDLRAAPYDPGTTSIGRSVPLVAGVRRESIGTAQFDINAQGTLIYAPGGNAEIAHLVRMGKGGVITPLPVDSAAYMRWDLSRDGRWLATVSQAPGYNELAIHDLKNRQAFVWLRDEVIQQPLWSDDGATILTTVRDSNRTAILRGSPFDRTPPDTIAVSDTVVLPTVLDRHGSTIALGSAGTFNTVVQFDPSRRPVSYDTLAHDRLFVMMSPDARHLLFSVAAGSRIVMTSAPPGSWERQVATNAVEPIWLSNSEVLYRSGVTWLEARIDPVTSQVVSTGTVWGSDPRFADTFGWSNRPDWHGGIIYLQGPPRVTATYLRIIPHWVTKMKHLVDEANR
jgi:hypothetical protein